ncbi:uncharacterized protein J7T54_004847 [Emericellopsis cladophorae]|uniref:Uncharacterized protein n=1 Tax=Emericellopsis cladophorae TaxID=2686198 RepID=A0A9P9Y6B4_9HYPO|nr:uncharacterized protein J7T54_004847 [Emericellopsis cladophorae]KAI6784301.1 hypothetical protein J7T54_004847 [Emericellopsis cladophorae]
MAITETDVLTNYLLNPAPLPLVVTFERFAEHFPPAQRDAPAVRALWQDLVAQRERVLAAVRENIEEEVVRGRAMRREVLRKRREEGTDEVDAEIEMERALFGDLSGAKRAKHTLDSIIPELESAALALEADVAKLQDEEVKLLELVKSNVDSLSDLRYGKFSNAKIRDEVLDGLRTLQETCSNK